VTNWERSDFFLFTLMIVSYSGSFRWQTFGWYNSY